MLKEGMSAPDFCLQDEEGTERCLRDFRGRWVVLYFYPKDMTPGCTREAEDFRDLAEEFSRLGAVILGVSVDPPESHRKFKEKLGLPFHLLADTDKTVVQAYGVWQEKKRFGRTYFGTVRATFVIDPEGKIAKVYPSVRVAGHARKVLEDLKDLMGHGS